MWFGKHKRRGPLALLAFKPRHVRLYNGCGLTAGEA